jgi:hypothetical protein
MKNLDTLTGLVGDAGSQHKSLQADAKKLSEKWEKTGLLEGLDGYDKNSMSILLENQAKQLVQESSRTGTASNSEEWSGVALPLVRRVFAEIAAKDFVSVQPMNLPSGLVFFLDFKYGTSQPGFDVVSGVTRDGSGTLHGQTNTSGNPSGGLYGSGRFVYSINEAASDSIAAPTSASVNLSEINFNAEVSASVNNAHLRSVTITTGSNNFTNVDAEGVRGFSISGSNIISYFPEFTTIDTSGNVKFIVSGSDSIAGVVVKYQKQPTDVTRGDFEDTSTSGSAVSLDIPEIDVQLRSETIVAKTRKLKASWTPEFAQDLNAYHSIDAEAELTSMLSEYISMEIDLEILDMLIENAVSSANWSAKVGFDDDGLGNNEDRFSEISGASNAYTKNSWYQTLGIKIQKVSNEIHRKTLRGGANFLVTSPTVATILESIPGYAADTDGDQSSFAMGVQKIGALNNRFTVYKNPYMTENIILMGYRGSQFLETGAVYAPYVPLIMTPLVYDPTNFTPRKGVMTRYAKKMVRPEFYGKIQVAHLDQV